MRTFSKGFFANECYCECYCDDDSQKNYDGNVTEKEKENNSVVGFDNQVSAKINTISLTWDQEIKRKNAIDKMKLIHYWREKRSLDDFAKKEVSGLRIY